MQDSVTVGDEIITAGGIHGFVREVDDLEVTLEIAEGVVVRLDRRAIAAVAEDVPLEGGEEDEDPGPDPEDQAEESLKG
jgi:preprotein translocase subunit YajC